MSGWSKAGKLKLHAKRGVRIGLVSPPQLSKLALLCVRACVRLRVGVCVAMHSGDVDKLIG